MRWSVLLALSLLLFSGVNGFELTTFTNNSSEVSVIFGSGGEDSSTVSITIPWNANVTSARVKVFGGLQNVLSDKIGNGLSDEYIFGSQLDGVVVDDDFIYASDNSRHRVMVYNRSSKEFVYQIGVTDTAGNTNSTLDNPSDVFVNDTSLFVVDRDNHRIMVYNKTNGGFLYQIFGGSGSDTSHFNTPQGIFVSGDTIYVADKGNNRVMMLNLNGSYKNSFGSYGSGNYQFNGPTDVAVNGSGYLFVVDSGNQRVVVYDPSFGFVKILGTTGVAGSGSNFTNPNSVQITSENVYVSDTALHRVAVFDNGLNYLQDVGISGQAATDVNDITKLNSPTGLGFYNGSLFIGDSGLNRVVNTEGFYPTNLSINSGVEGGVGYDWVSLGELNGETSVQLNVSKINQAISTCSPLSNCSFHLGVKTDTAGYVKFKSLNITYDLIPFVRLNGSLSGFSTTLDFKQGGVSKGDSPYFANPDYDIFLTSGEYDLTITVDKPTQVLGHVYTFYNVNLVSEEDFLTLQEPGTTAFTSNQATPLLLACVKNSLSYSSALLRFSWSSVSQSLIEDENKLQLYKCDSWDFNNVKCTGSWSITPSTRDNNNNYFETNQVNANGCYAIATTNQASLNINVTLNDSFIDAGNSLGFSGYVNSSAGVFVSGATVSYELRDSSNVLHVNGSTITDGNGFYSTNLIAPDKSDTFTLTLTASKEGFINGVVQKSVSVIGCDIKASVCSDQSSCESNNWFWCGDGCQSFECGATCSFDSCSACLVESDCVSAGCNWCGDGCQRDVCGACAPDLTQACKSESDCVSVGGLWYNGFCYPNIEGCNFFNLGLCETEQDCVSAGGDWCEEGVCKGVCATVNVTQLNASDTGEGGLYSFNVFVKNDYTVPMVDTTIVVSGGGGEVNYSVTPKKVTLQPGGEVNFLVEVVVPENKSLSDYNLRYEVVSSVSNELQTSFVTGFNESIKLPPKVFLDVNLLKDSVQAGQRINFQVSLFNARNYPTNVDLTYSVKRGDKVVVNKSEQVVLDNNLSYAQTLVIPTSTLSGEYVLEVVASHKGGRVVSSKSFVVHLALPWIVLVFLVIIGVSIVLYALKFRNRIAKIGEIEEGFEEFNPEKFK